MSQQRLYEPLTSSDGEQSARSSWWATIRERRLATTAIVAILLVGLLAIGLLLLQGQYSELLLHTKEVEERCLTTQAPNVSSTTEDAATNICTTPGCVLSASRLLRQMDTSVEPCDDFYRYTCGRWAAEHPRPPTTASWTEFGRATRILRSQLQAVLASGQPPTGAVGQAYHAYRSCTNMTDRDLVGLAPLTAALERAGGWPAVTADWSGENYSWLEATVLSYVYAGPGPLVTLDISPDEMNATRHLLHVDQTSLTMERGLLIDPDTNAALHTAYEQFISDIITLLADRSTNGTDAADTSTNASTNGSTNAAAAAEIMQFEVQLAQLTVADEHRRNSSRMYNKMTLAQLQNLTDRVQPNVLQWTELVRLALALGGANSSSPPPQHMEVVVAEPDYLRNLTRLLDQTDRRVIANYLGWRIVLSSLGSLSSSAGQLLFQFQKAYTGAVSPTPVEDACFDWLGKAMGPAVSYIYVTQAFPNDTKAKVSDMVSDLRATFGQRLDNITWMRNSTRVQAHRKLDQMISNVGYPNWMANSTELDDFFEGFSGQQDHFNACVALSRLTIAKGVALLTKPVDRNKFVGFPSTVNAYYEPTLNSITIPAGILQPVFYDNGLEVLNYGSIGAVIGHEITHGFDDFGRQYDADGSLSQWWDADTLAEFRRRIGCVARQYSNYTVPQLQGLAVDTHVNGQLTLGENIADGGGLGEAYQAYFEGYVARHGHEPSLPALQHLSAQQLFFIAFAQLWCSDHTVEFLHTQLLSDPHSPHHARVVGAVSNSPQFAAAFQCPAGSAMNPGTKCSVW